MDRVYYVAAENILGLATNVVGFQWSFAITPPQATQAAFESCAVRLESYVQSDAEYRETSHLSSQTGKYHYFEGVPESDVVAYERSFAFGKKLRLRVEGLGSGVPRIVANRAYDRLVKHRVMNLHSLGYVVTDLAALQMLRRGYAPLHCSAFKIGRNTVLVFAPPNTGKTLTAVKAVREFGASFIAEDLAITDGKHIFAVPWTSTFRYYPELRNRIGARLKNLARSALPLLDVISMGRPSSIQQYLDTGSITTTAEVTHVVILERGNAELQRATRDEVYAKASNINRYEFHYRRSPVILAYEYFNPSVSIDEAEAAEQRILRRLVDHAAETLIVRAPSATAYADMVVSAIRS